MDKEQTEREAMIINDIEKTIPFLMQQDIEETHVVVREVLEDIRKVNNPDLEKMLIEKVEELGIGFEN